MISIQKMKRLNLKIIKTRKFFNNFKEILFRTILSLKLNFKFSSKTVDLYEATLSSESNEQIMSMILKAYDSLKKK